MKGYEDFIQEIKPRSSHKKPLAIKAKMIKAKAKVPVVVPPVKKSKSEGPPVNTASQSINKPALLNPTYGGTLLGIGTVLAGVSTWLIFLHGDISCTDGRTRQTCPDVYNTRGLGYGGLVLGLSAMSVGVTALLLNPLWPNQSAASKTTPTSKNASGALKTSQSPSKDFRRSSLSGQTGITPLDQGAMLQWGLQF